MALMNCPDCKSLVSNKAALCPHCGVKISKLAEVGTKHGDERRKNKRIKKKILLKINGELGLLTDISRRGIRLSTTTMPSDRTVHIKLKVDEDTFELNGIIRWEQKKRSFSNLIEIGVQVNEAPRGYYEFIDELYQKDDPIGPPELNEKEESILDEIFNEPKSRPK